MNGADRLFHLNDDAGERVDQRARHAERANALRSEVEALSDAHLRRQAELRSGAPVRSMREEDLPEDARKALEALGYIEADDAD